MNKMIAVAMLSLPLLLLASVAGSQPAGDFDASVKILSSKAKNGTCATVAAQLQQLMERDRYALASARKRENALLQEIIEPTIRGPHRDYVAQKKIELAAAQVESDRIFEMIFSIGDQISEQIKTCRH